MVRSRIVAGAALVLLGAGIFLFVQHQKTAQKLVPKDTTPTTIVAQHVGPRVPANAATSTYTPRIPPAGYLEYHNLTYHFSLFYPDDLSIKEYPSIGTSLTVTFKNTAGDQGFQVFVTPYGNTQITTERFKLDEPSGVMTSSSQIMLDGIPATVFFGKNSAMGDTREVWSIHHGFLFEISTYKSLDTWLAQIMTSWQFLSS